jgi:hypothetical protein
MTALVFALVGIGVLQLPKHRTLDVAAGVLFAAALLIALTSQAGW